jgi:hypothetical protein
MEFSQVVKIVKDYLITLTIEEKINLFVKMFNAPVSYKDGGFYLADTEYDINRMNDYFKIREHWMSVKEFDKLYEYIENSNKNE